MDERQLARKIEEPQEGQSPVDEANVLAAEEIKEIIADEPGMFRRIPVTETKRKPVTKISPDTGVDLFAAGDVEQPRRESLTMESIAGDVERQNLITEDPEMFGPVAAARIRAQQAAEQAEVSRTTAQDEKNAKEQAWRQAFYGAVSQPVAAKKSRFQRLGEWARRVFVGTEAQQGTQAFAKDILKSLNEYTTGRALGGHTAVQERDIATATSLAFPQATDEQRATFTRVMIERVDRKRHNRQKITREEVLYTAEKIFGSS